MDVWRGWRDWPDWQQVGERVLSAAPAVGLALVVVALCWAGWVVNWRRPRSVAPDPGPVDKQRVRTAAGRLTDEHLVEHEQLLRDSTRALEWERAAGKPGDPERWVPPWQRPEERP